MRIAYVINSVEGGGAALPVPGVVRVLRDCGAEVTVLALAPRDRRALPAFVAAGLDVQVRDGGDRDHLAAARWLDERVTALRPDLLWTSLSRATLLGQLVGMRRRTMVASWQHNAFLKPANLRLLRAMRRRSVLWIGDSETVTALTAARLRVPTDRLACWPLFSADASRPAAVAWRAGDPVRLGSLGRLHPAKGYDVLLDALALLRARGADLPRFELTIAGEGAQRAMLEHRIREAGLTDHVSLPGFVSAPHDFLAGLHVYCQPSRVEGLCIAAHEALSAGVPAIVSAVGEMPRSVRDGMTGLVVPPGDAHALAEALRRMLAHPERLATWGAAARADMQTRFGSAAFAANGSAIYRRLDALVAHRRTGDAPLSAGRARSGRSA
jgi:glycosyltransferase involved in cell wall biosynthesis